MASLIRSLGYRKLVLAGIDFIALVLVATAILTIRPSLFVYELTLAEVIFFLASSVVAIPTFRELNLYKHRLFSTRSDQIVCIAKGMLIVGIVQVLAIFLIKDPGLLAYSRLNVVLYLVGGWVVVSLLRVGVYRTVYTRRYGNGTGRRRILAVGAGRAGQHFATRVDTHPELGIALVGFVDDQSDKIGKWLLGRRIFGPVTDIARIVETVKAEEIFITINSIQYERLLEVIETCRTAQVPVTVTANHFRIIHNRIDTSEFDYIDSLTLRPSDFKSMSWRLKRTIDFTGALLLLLLIGPMLLLIAAAVRLTSDGPVFYRSQVVGRNGRLFTWYKFRTMVVNRDEAIHRAHLESIIKGNGSTLKLNNDPRVTTVGRYLRKYSLDELPQLFNVLRGEMSLIGPRPCLQYEYEHFDDWHKQRFDVTPGMTGLWQVTGRNRSDVTFNDSIILDLYYIQNYSLWLDAKIFMKTIPTVLFGRGGA